MAGGKWLPAAVVAGVCLGSLTLAQSAAAAMLTPASPTVVAGSSVSITLFDTINAADLIGAVDLQVTFDTSLLTLTAVTNGALLYEFDTPIFNVDPVTLQPSIGRISISQDPNFDDAPSGSDSVLTLTFTALPSAKSTSTQITATTAPVAKNVGEEYQLYPAISDTITIKAASTGPTTVPEPGTLILVLAPMLAAASLKRRDRC